MTPDYKIQILMLEDSDSDAEMVMHALNRSDFAIEIKREERRDKFLGALEDYTPDIIISDYNLPGYNGRQAYLDMIERGHEIPFILVTGSLPDDVAVECLQTGIDDYIIKDRLSRLPEAVAAVLAKWRTEEEKKTALEKLVESQKRLAAAETLAQLGNWEWELDTGKSAWSDQMFVIFEVDPEFYSPSYNAFIQFIHPDDLKKVGWAAKQVSDGKVKETDLTFRIITAKKTNKVIHAIYKSKKDAGSSGITLFGTVQDVTKLYETEKALRELTEQLEKKVEERTRELNESNKALAHRNIEITDGINYAQRIQKAIINKPTEAIDTFNGRFTLLIPKDIVSGDFFWHYDIGDMHFVAAVDCTGHGVPGALMSMIGYQFLNRIIVEQECYEPSEILRILDKKLVEALHQNSELEVRDGMDIALCRIDEKAKKISFSGALRPLFYYNTTELVEINGSKHPIGGFRNTGADKIFAQEEINYKTGDCIYLTSDGYYSQFNHYTGKKMLKNRMRKILESVAMKDAGEQEVILKRYFNEWKGNTEQVDDVLVIGLRF